MPSEKTKHNKKPKQWREGRKRKKVEREKEKCEGRKRER